MHKRSFVALAATLAIILLGAPGAFADSWDDCDGWERDDRKGRFCEIREYSMADLGSLEVDATPNGGIKVAAWGQSEIKVMAKVSVWDEDENDARDIAASIDIFTDGGRVRAESDRRKNWSVSYRIQAPSQTDLDLESHNGGISVAGIEGHLRIETHNGGLSLDSVAGDVVARTQNGGVSVELDGSSWRGTGLDVETTNGGVTLDIPSNYSAELETGTVNGRIKIDFPVTVQGEIGRRLTTTLGSGGAPIKVKTTNGGVRINEN
jgi:DUF4097 and DUF4098 domain-containing protein YvlB